MCGIAGIVHLDPRESVDSTLLRRMNDTLTHRGPDESGFLAEGPVGFAMRRLSIIDLSSGRQPLHNEDGSVSVVFNGEIYNYRALRETLQAKGHRLKTTSDTEVLPHLWEDHGADLVHHLRGMFAFALWDRRSGTVLLARDRLGIKPLYWARVGDRLLFGSELKSLLVDPALEKTLDPEALCAYLRFGYVGEPRTILRTARKVPPGCIVMADGSGPSVRSYWQPPETGATPEETARETDVVDGLEQRLRDSVRAHLVSDVPVGAFLSGGIDSSTVVALMAQEAGSRIRTFSIGFREPDFDESPWARRVAGHLGTCHEEMIVEPAHVDLLGRIVRSFDEPFGDPSALPTWFVSELASRSVKVVLSGDGGDELFAGYERYQWHLDRAYADRIPRFVRERLLRPVASLLPTGTSGKRFLRNVSLMGLERYLDSISYFPFGLQSKILDPAVWNGTAAGSPGDTEQPATLADLQRFDILTYLPGDILTKVDRMSMAHSLEARVPLLDHDVVEYALALPENMRIRNGSMKYLLKQVARRLLPAEIVDRPKQGFAVPLEAWFRGRPQGFLREVLEDPRSRQREYFDSRGLGDFLAGERAGRLSSQLWILAVLELWQREVMGPAPLS